MGILEDSLERSRIEQEKQEKEKRLKKFYQDTLPLRYNSPDTRVRHSQTMYMDEELKGLIHGDDSELRELDEVKKTIERLYTTTKPKSDRGDQIPGIDLKKYNIEVVNVYTGAQPNGFDFKCTDVSRLIDQVKMFTEDLIKPGDKDMLRTLRTPIFNIDSSSSLLGRFAGAVTKGTGFRQISTGAALHLELALSGECNIHVDSVGIVCGINNYNFANFIGHGLNDLLIGYAVPQQFYGSSGNVSLRPDIQLNVFNDPNALNPSLDFHNQNQMDHRQLGVSVLIGYKVSWK